MDVRSPKLTNRGSRWYDYYAGYSEEFVEDVIDSVLGNSQDCTVADPWNGSGTTTVVAAKKGHRAIGFDLNPALVAIAKGRHLPSSVKPSLIPLAKELIQGSYKLSAEDVLVDEDPLSQWFGPTTCLSLRAIERAIYTTLVAREMTENSAVNVNELSTLAAFYYCALFTLVRELTMPFRTSNPTWIKVSADEGRRLGKSSGGLDDRFHEIVNQLSRRLVLPPEASESQGFLIEQRSAENLPAPFETDLILTSPPYCTRIDYIVATMPELAVLGYRKEDTVSLREQMLGTPRLGRSGSTTADGLGTTATLFLKSVRNHPSKASTTYYSRYFATYLSRLHRSLLGFSSAITSAGTIAMVVQDSYYKQVRFDLPAIVTEIGELLGLHSSRIDFAVPRTMAGINPGAKAYRKKFDAVESLVLLTKGKTTWK